MLKHCKHPHSQPGPHWLKQPAFTRSPRSGKLRIGKPTASSNRSASGPATYMRTSHFTSREGKPRGHDMKPGKGNHEDTTHETQGPRGRDTRAPTLLEFPHFFQHVPTEPSSDLFWAARPPHDYFSWPSDSNPCCPGPTSPSLWLRTPVYQRGQAVRGRATARVMAARAGRTCSLSVHKSLPQHRSLTSFTGMGSLAALNTFQIRACSNHG